MQWLDLSFLEVSALLLTGITILVGFFLGEAARRLRLPALIGYMAGGVLLGPSLGNLFSEPLLVQLSFFTNVGLGLVAFTIGSELNLSSLRRFGRAIVVIIFAESLMACLVVWAAIYLLTGDMVLALLFGAMAPASAPAGTVAVIQEYRARGPLTKALYAVVGFDDGLAVIIYGFLAALARGLLVGHGGGTAALLPSLWQPFLEIVASLGLGAVIGLGFYLLARPIRKPQEALILLIGTVLVTTGLSLRWHLSLILSNMMVGLVLVNIQRDSLVHKVREPLLTIMPLVYILFFSLAGAHLDFLVLPALGLVGLVYILARIAGLMGGAWLGAVAGGAEATIRKYLGFGILSQAGVAIGLALLVMDEFGRLAVQYQLPRAAELGAVVLTTITASSVVFEVIGPIATRFALARAGEIPAEKPLPTAARSDHG